MKIKRWDGETLRFRMSMVALSTSLLLSACAPTSARIPEADVVVQTENVQPVAPTEPAISQDKLPSAPSADTQAAPAAQVNSVSSAAVVMPKNKLMLFGAVY